MATTTNPKYWTATSITPPLQYEQSERDPKKRKSPLRFAIEPSPSCVEAILRMPATELPDSVVIVFVVDIETPYHRILPDFARAA